MVGNGWANMFFEGNFSGWSRLLQVLRKFRDWKTQVEYGRVSLQLLKIMSGGQAAISMEQRQKLQEPIHG